MRNIICVLTALVLSVSVYAQSTDYLRRYNLLLNRVGPSGVGIETLLENWQKAEPENPDMLEARFYFYISKSQGTEIISSYESKFLGANPVLTLKDSSGVDVHYYEVLKYEEALFVDALEILDQAIDLCPDRLDFRFLKANAYMSYERGEMDFTLSNILGLVHDFMNTDRKWQYKVDFSSELYTVDKEEFASLMKDYCHDFFYMGTPASYQAFLKLSQRLNGYFKKDADFVANIGSYYHVAEKDYKTALKYYDKALKLQPGHRSIINNALIAARSLKDAKLEKKYLKMLGK